MGKSSHRRRVPAGGGAISPDLTALAQAFGCHAERVAAPDMVRPALERAFAANAPAVVEVMVERDYPLSGSPAVGWWDVPVPTYLKSSARGTNERSRRSNMFDFTDRVVIVTGAAGNLGSAVARAFQATGANLVLVDRKPDRLPSLFP